MRELLVNCIVILAPKYCFRFNYTEFSIRLEKNGISDHFDVADHFFPLRKGVKITSKKTGRAYTIDSIDEEQGEDEIVKVIDLSLIPNQILFDEFQVS